jgi:hypothetical protein
MVYDCLSFQGWARLGIAVSGSQWRLEENWLESDEYGVQSRVSFIVARQWAQVSDIGQRVQETRRGDSLGTRR